MKKLYLKFVKLAMNQNKLNYLDNIIKTVDNVNTKTSRNHLKGNNLFYQRNQEKLKKTN